MHVLGALRLACYQILLLGVLGKRDKTHLHGARTILAHFSSPDRTHRPPTYMMHLYRNFKMNQTRPVDYMDHEQADTIRSILSNSKVWFILLIRLSRVSSNTNSGFLVLKRCRELWGFGEPLELRTEVKSAAALLLRVPVASGCQISAPDTFNPHLARGWISPGSAWRLMPCANPSLVMWIRPSPDILIQISCWRQINISPQVFFTRRWLD